MKNILLLFSVFAVFACKKDKGNDENVVTIPASDYELSADGLTLVKWKNENTAVLNMQADAILRKVKVIGNAAFYQHKTLGSITLPEGLTDIDNIAFYKTKLRSIQRVLLPLVMKRFLIAKFLFSTFLKVCKLLEETHLSLTK